MPSFFSIFAIRHHLVIPDWNRLAPTKKVKANHHGLTKYPSATLAIINVPAITCMALSIVIFKYLFFHLKSVFNASINVCVFFKLPPLCVIFFAGEYIGTNNVEPVVVKTVTDFGFYEVVFIIGRMKNKK